MRNAAVMLVVKDGKILSVSRRHDKDRFGLPGGKCEENETPELAAIRECFEETGIKVINCQYIFRRDEPRDKLEGEDFHCYAFYAEEWSGAPQSSEEGDVVWLTKLELCGDKGAFPEYNRHTLEVFREMYPDIFIFHEGV